MELEFQPKTTQYLRRSLCRTQFHEETAETIVPESYPDIDRVLMGSAVVSMRGKEYGNAAVTVSGGIHADILYAAQEGGEILPIEVYLPFSLKADAPEVSDRAVIVARPWVRSVDSRMVGSRKLVTRVNLGCDIEAYEPAEATFYQPEDVPETIQLRTAEYPMALTVDAGEKQFQLNEELELPQGEALGDTIFSCTPRLEITERRLAGNKAAFKGMAHLHMLYADEAGKPTVCDARFPFSQYCELGDVYEGEELQVIPIVTGCELRRVARASGDVPAVELQILAQCLVTRQTKIPVCEDAYSLQGDLSPSWDAVSMESRLDSREETRTIRERHSCDARETIDTQVTPDHPELRRGSDGAELVIPCTANVLYYDAAGKPQSATMHVRSAEPFSLADNAECTAAAPEVADAVASVTAEGVELRCTLVAETVSTAPVQLRTLRSAELTEQASPRRRSAVVARRLAEGETLWELAKANHTTVDRIRRANGLESDHVPAATMLLIPI